MNIITKMRSIGLDLGARKISYCAVLDGEVLERTTVTKLPGLRRYIGPKSSPAKIAIESGGESWWIADQLRTWGHTVTVLDTTRVKQLGIGQHKRKNDRIDAEVLARAVESGRLPVAHELSKERRQLRYHLGVRRALVQTRAQYVTSIRGILRAQGTPVRSCHTTLFAAKVRQAELATEVRAMLEPLVVMIDHLSEQIGTVEKTLEDLCADEPCIALLRTAVGVGPVVSAAFVSVIDEPRRFRNAHQVQAYLGLVPSEHTSGRRRLGSITKQGNNYLRQVLIQSAWLILRQRNPDDPIKVWGLAIAERRGRRIAAVAVARRLAGILWAMWRDGTSYRPDRVGKRSADGLEQHARSIQEVSELMREVSATA